MKHSGLRSTVLILALMLTATGAALLGSAPTSDPLVVPQAARPPVIDGVLDDEAWASALKVSEFMTFQPDFGRPPSQKSEGFLTYDAENFYFAMRCYDTEPDKIKAAVSKRDAIFGDDYAAFLIDTFNDTQSAFGFIVNPLGIQGDGMLDINANLDSSFDMVWDSKGQVNKQEGCYTVELRVPLKSIRFPNKPTLIMRVGFFRQLVRTSEMNSFPALNPAKGSVLGQTLVI